MGCGTPNQYDYHQGTLRTYSPKANLHPYNYGNNDLRYSKDYPQYQT
jgi:hypothetical protein